MKIRYNINQLLLFFTLINFYSIYGMEKVEDLQKAPEAIQYGFSARQGMRGEMEDKESIVIPFGSKDAAFIGLYDGHGSDKVAVFVKTNLHENVLDLISEKKDDEKTLRKAFEITDNDLRKYPYARNSGSAAIVVWIKPTQMLIGWLGDSRAVLANKNGDVVWSSTDHKPSSEREKKRIQLAGGIVLEDEFGTTRVTKEDEDRRLSLSRAFGDFDLKNETGKSPVSNEPDITILTRKPDDAFLILACDGVWDVIDNQEAVKTVKFAIAGYEAETEKLNDPKSWPKVKSRGNTLIAIREAKDEKYNSIKALYAAQKLRDKAYDKGSTDNISVIVILLDRIASK